MINTALDYYVSEISKDIRQFPRIIRFLKIREEESSLSPDFKLITLGTSFLLGKLFSIIEVSSSHVQISKIYLEKLT
jgi:hypothetical protein